MKIEGLSELLDSLKEEVDAWPLDPMPENEALIRRGIQLSAMDILLAEMTAPGGFESYVALSERVKLSEDEYSRWRKQLDPFVRWFQSLLLQHALRLKQQGFGEGEALDHAIATGAESLNEQINLCTQAPA